MQCSAACSVLPLNRDTDMEEGVVVEEGATIDNILLAKESVLTPANSVYCVYCQKNRSLVKTMMLNKKVK